MTTETPIKFTIRRNGEALTGYATSWVWDWGTDPVSDAARRANYGARPDDRKARTLTAMRRGAQRALARADIECFF